MVTRSLTDVFILMRNNAMQSRYMYSEQHMSDRVALMRREADPEAGSSRESRVPPDWVDGCEELQYTLSRIRGKMREIEVLERKQVQRPTLDDSSAEEQQIEALTNEITKMFGVAHRLLQQIEYRSKGSSLQEERLGRNVVTALATTLQDLFFTFRRGQSNYLKKLHSREEQSQQYFSTPDVMGESGSPYASNAEDFLFEQSHLLAEGSVTQQQLLLLEENTKMVAQREREVQNIVRSIFELNQLFRDIIHMVADQGTVLDQIDYNVEQTQVKVQAGVQQLRKADAYQRGNRKMLCIIILAGFTLLFLIILIITKS